MPDLLSAHSASPMIRQFLAVKERHPDAIVFFRLGDFYEMFFDDAITGSRELELTLTARNRGKDDEAPMCGVPVVAHETYVARLVRKGFKVAICEQVQDPSQAKGLVEREVVRVVTPGTYVPGVGEEPAASRFLMCLYPRGGLAGAAFLDVSTGDFELHELPLHGNRAALPDLLARYEPREILLPDGDDVDEKALASLRDLPPGSAVVTRIGAEAYQPFEAHRLIRELFGERSVESLGLDTRPLALAAAGAAIGYVQRTQKATLTHLALPRWVADRDVLTLDASTLRNLEVLRASAGTERGSLYQVIDQTATAMGARLLKAFLMRPLAEPLLIRERQDAVGALMDDALLRDKVRAALGKIRDLERLTGRIALKAAGPRDVAALASSLEPLPALRALLSSSGSGLVASTAGSLDTLTDLVEDVRARLVADPPLAATDGGLVPAGFSKEIDELRALSSDAKSALAAIEARERAQTKIGNLKVRYNKVFGYYIEVSKSQLSLVPGHYERKQTLVGAERFTTPELKEHEQKVLHAAERLAELEHGIFSALRDRLAAAAPRIQDGARRVSLLDVLQSFAHQAALARYVRPIVSASDRIHIKDGRHPVVEAVTGFRSFIPNDTHLDNADRQILIVTGPNMGGKSTYLRQVALITLMAQTGSFVPAAEAEIGIVDRIFTRVGASDDLARGRSTFLVEMSETASILAHATPRSLVILDEIGRGTSTFDGLSLAWAVAEHLHNTPRVAAKTLFATHYHELTDLALTAPRVKNVQIAVREWNDQIVFLRKVIEGASDKSYGISVAKLAGLPKPVITRAREILQNLALAELDERGAPRLAHASGQPRLRRAEYQPSLFESSPKHPVLQELEDADVAALTPLQALKMIDRWQRSLKS